MAIVDKMILFVKKKKQNKSEAAVKINISS